MNVLRPLAALALTGCSAVGIRSFTAEPDYQTIAYLGEVEIRQYTPRLTASVTVQGDEITARAAGFRRLARYIFGANATQTSLSMTAPVVQAPAKIPMTAPVAQAQTNAGEWTISFYMPADTTLATIPKPVDPAIVLHEVPGATEAVYRFSGARDAIAVAHAQARLAATLSNSPWRIAGTPAAWFYDPPWTLPWARRNEVALPVVRREG